MLTIRREVITYMDAESGRDFRHHALIALVGAKNILLSHPNLFLRENAVSSLETSNRYSAVIAMFYRFLATKAKFWDVEIGKYHVIADNSDVKQWQVSRQVARVKAQKETPSSATIFEDAKVLMVFFRWLRDSGYVTNVNVKTRTWIANFKNSRTLMDVQKEARVAIDAKNIKVLDTERRQHKKKTLITDAEIVALCQAYSDPVYEAMFKLALGTAMRPMDLCRFPYIGSGANKHILPYSDMAPTESVTVPYLVKSSKGNKDRTIRVHLADLRALEAGYIRPYYAQRARLYQDRFGKRCPPSILFLNAEGFPVTPSRISSRTNDAKKRAMVSQPGFREGVVFYDARHWWPTRFLVRFFGNKLLTEAADVLDLAAAEVLKNQMGHEDLETTYKYYIDQARLLVLAHQGHVHELVTEPTETVEEFVHYVDGSARAPHG